MTITSNHETAATNDNVLSTTSSEGQALTAHQASSSTPTDLALTLSNASHTHSPSSSAHTSSNDSNLQTSVNLTTSQNAQQTSSTWLTPAPPVPTTTSALSPSMMPRPSFCPPRHTASSSASSSSSSSGTATPTNRLQHNSNLTFLSNTSSSASSRSPYASQLAARGRRITHHSSTPRSRFPTAASAMASTDNVNVMPSIFGYYSHDSNPTIHTTSTTSTSASPSPSPSPANTAIWHAAPNLASHQAGASRTPAQARINRTSYPSSNHTSPVVSSNFYQYSARQHANAPTSVESTYRPAQLGHHTTPASTASANTHSSLVASSIPTPQPTFQETTTISFTWTIADLHLLRDEVELTPPPSQGGRSVSAGAGKSDVWTNQPIFGDNKWKLELIRTTRPLPDRAHHSASHHPNHAHSELTFAPLSDVDLIDAEGDQADANSQRNSITILSVYLTALVLDYTHSNVEIPASIMIGLRPIGAATARRGAEDGGYLWRRFYHYTFHKEADLFTCNDLPSLSEMLLNLNVARHDSIALTLQLGLGPGHTNAQNSQLEDTAIAPPPVEIQGHHLVPRAVLNSLHGLLDDANTGDVRIIVRERGFLLSKSSQAAAMSDDGDSAAHQVGCVEPYPIGSRCPKSSCEGEEAEAMPSNEHDPDRVVVRDRVLWAHASVLKSRSDYFQTMLASDFSEGIGRSYGADTDPTCSGRNVRTLRIPDADFVTAYWFLRYLYTDDIQFADKQDLRSSVLDEEWAKGADFGYLTADSSIAGEQDAGRLRDQMLVDWTPVSQLKELDAFEMEQEVASHAGMAYSMTRGHLSSSSVDLRDVSGPFVLHAPASRTTTSGSLRQRTSGVGLGTNVSAGGSATTISAPTSPSVPSACASASSAAKHDTVDETCRGASSSHRTLTDASARRCSSTLDSHSHPCAEPGPASALSIFKLAHRYHMQDLSKLASIHMVATLTPQSAFSMLLATSMYTELHTRIKTYVYQHWHVVSHTQEFERCCDEVSMGMWGGDAGKTMRAFVKSLVSPLRFAQS
ncbi:uncharacterized protein MEPE_06818 [Melanopsichium pennsylvanicum]|uniref:BTB domain-containing protein n=2 Tax=Melanopsichium pennsylvanicum TaxID=63383 RepID=A0AAJ4XTZ3_9BASI|nr:conserved hypothetical protein [Melanopsichium pennsylvanicum 4]SNX88107.1 uncharacterized protein MEPE_06818 [Melanopsichium pennsylvanicum]